MAHVVRGDYEHFDVMFRRFQRQVEREGIFKRIRQVSRFKSKGERRRQRRREAVRKERKRSARQARSSALFSSKLVYDQRPTDRLGASATVASLTEAQSIFVAVAAQLPDGAFVIVKDQEKNRYGFAGGGVNRDDDSNRFIETPEEAAAREQLEETGLTLAPLLTDDIISIRRYQNGHFKVLYMGRVIAGTPRPGDEIEDVRLVSSDEILRLIEDGSFLESHGTSFRNHILRS